MSRLTSAATGATIAAVDQRAYPYEHALALERRWSTASTFGAGAV